MLLRPTRAIEVGGAVRHLALDLRALCMLERRTGHDLAGLAPDNPEALRALLWAMVQSDSPGIAERAMGAAGLEHVRIASELIAASFSPAGETASGAEPFSWFDVWAMGRYDVGLSEEEFWLLTPRMFSALCLRVSARREHEFHCAGITAAAITNVHIDPSKTAPLEPVHFVPTRAGVEAWKKREEAVGRALKRKLSSLAGAFPGAKMIPGKS